MDQWWVGIRPMLSPSVWFWSLDSLCCLLKMGVSAMCINILHQLLSGISHLTCDRILHTDAKVYRRLISVVVSGSIHAFVLHILGKYDPKSMWTQCTIVLWNQKLCNSFFAIVSVSKLSKKKKHQRSVLLTLCVGIPGVFPSQRATYIENVHCNRYFRHMTTIIFTTWLHIHLFTALYQPHNS